MQDRLRKSNNSNKYALQLSGQTTAQTSSLAKCALDGHWQLKTVRHFLHQIRGGTLEQITCKNLLSVDANTKLHIKLSA